MKQARRRSAISSRDDMNSTKSPESDFSDKISAEMLPQCSVVLERLEYTEEFI